MNFSEAVIALKYGYKVRQKHWPNGDYIFWDDTQDVFLDENSNRHEFTLIMFESLNWEILK